MTAPASLSPDGQACKPRRGGSPRRGRRTALFVVVLILAALGAQTVVSWPAVVEGYSLVALCVGFWGGKGRAAARLGRLGSIRAVSAVRIFYYLAPPDITALIRALSHTDEQVRSTAVDRLACLRSSAGDAVPALGKILRDSGQDPSLRADAAGAIGVIGVASEEGITALREAERDPHPSVRQVCTIALERLGIAPQPTRNLTPE